VRYAIIGTIICIGLGGYLVATRPVEHPGPGQVELRFAFPSDVRSLSAYTRIVRRFMELNPDIYVTLEPVVGDFRRTLQRDMVADMAADVMFDDDDDMTVFASEGHYLDLGPFIEQDRFDLDAYYRPAVESFRWNDRQYGLPGVWGCSLILYNKDLFAEAGVTADPTTWTWDEFLDALNKLSRPVMRDGRMVRIYGYIRDNSAHAMCHIWQAGGTILQRQLECPDCHKKNDVADIDHAADLVCRRCGKSLAGAAEAWVGRINTPQAVRGVQFAVDLLKYTGRQQASQGSEIAMNQDLFAAGRLAMLRGGPFSAATLKDTNINWDIGYYPAGPGGRWTRFYCDGFSIWSKTKHPREAWRLLKFICGPQAMRVHAKDSASIPALKSVAESEYFNRPDTPWDEMKFVRAIDHARFMRKTPQWDKVSEVMSKYLDLVMLEPGSTGRMTPQEFGDRMQEETEKILARAARDAAAK
jgi:multiple sugar transport system substrate-binding protein